MSRRGLGGSSGTYNVRASELARERRVKTIRSTVIFLDDTQQNFDVPKRAKGHVLLDLVFQHLELVEKDYFGLQFQESGSNSDGLRWLDPSKSIKKQLKNGQPYSFFFRVKFYVGDPSKLQEEYTRYHFFLQLKRDIIEGRIVVPLTTACLLASYAVQSELGDYNCDEHPYGYLAEYRLVPNQSEDMERKITELHKLHKGQTPADAEFNFLDNAKRLDMYGVDLHRARHESYDSLLGFNMLSYRSCKNLWKSCVEHHTFFRLHSPRPTTKKPFFSLGSKFRYSGRTEYQTVEEGKRRARLERTFIRSPSKRFVRQTVPMISREGVEEKAKLLTPSKLGTRINGTSSHLRPYDSFNNKVVSSTSKEPRKAWTEGDRSDEEGGFLSEQREPSAFAPVLSTRIGYVDDEEPISETYELPSYADLGFWRRLRWQILRICNALADHFVRPPETNGHDDGIDLLTIRMKPDEHKRFGFNVKGGIDQNLPINVSRVAPNTPAERCIPRLNEGDQVLYINGQDVSGLTHAQVVQLIRSSCLLPSRELELTIKPNASVVADVPEPAFIYVPDLPHDVATRVPRVDALSESMLLLSEGLESGALIAQFEQLYRKKPGLSMSAARLVENTMKNRYRDISPYDTSRVLLRGGASGDYINANHVNMEVPTSGIINRYIAAQGPLPNTCTDFWQMIWEQQSTLIVMLTTILERGRIKCHQYWPAFLQTVDYGTLQVTCRKEQETSSFAFREFTLVNLENNEERHITHMQYIAWPDHEVPEDATDFLEFVMRVRQNRVGMVEPTIVHCSAGIGRTGVLILMETAMCLVEANEPVYPLDIVRSMRDQRAMLIQNSSQYKFVCEAIIKVYSEKVVRPQAEYQR